MGNPVAKSVKLFTRDPKAAAEAVFESHKGEAAWLDAFSEHLDQQRAREAFARTLDVWDLSQSEVARILGVSRQAVGKWVEKGLPPERAAMAADLAGATDLLVRYLKRDRIPAVVRRPIAAHSDATLLELLARDGSAAVLEACRQMFDFRHVGE
jgi:predicted transcriptional regulator